MIKRMISISTFVICLSSIILMTLPRGVKMTWADPGGLYVHYYSYFSFMPLGYGNWMPILTAILVIGATIMFLLQIIKPDISDKLSRRTLNCLILAVMFSLISIIVFNTTTALSGIITGMILLVAMLQYFSISRSERTNYRSNSHP